MNNTKSKLQRGETVLGGWIMVGHPSVAELLAGERFDWLGVDMEHTSISVRDFHDMALAVQGRGIDLLARLPGHDPDLTKRLLDCGAMNRIRPEPYAGKKGTTRSAGKKKTGSSGSQGG